MNFSEEFIQKMNKYTIELRKIIKENYEEGTILEVVTDFNERTLSTLVKEVKIIHNTDENLEENLKKIGFDNSNNCFLINTLGFIDNSCTNPEYVFDKKEIKTGDTVYVVLFNDGDPYGTDVLGVFTEKPDEKEIIEKYMNYLKHLDSLEKEDDDYLPYYIYIYNIVELKIS